MPFLSTSLRLIAYALGTALCFFLFAVFLERRQRRLLAAAFLGGLWHLANGLVLLDLIVIGNESRIYLAVVREIARVASWLAPAGLMDLAAGGWFGLAAYAAALPLMPAPAAYPWFLAATMSAAVLFTLRTPATDPIERRFQHMFGATLALTTAAALAGPNSVLLALAALTPPLCYLVFIFRFNLHGYLISRRIVFTLAMAAGSALYLLAVKLFSDTLEHRMEAFGPVVELILILSAAVIWLPLYEWLTRRIARRTETYVHFSRRVIEQAAGILDFGQRAQFLADGVAQAFHLRRAALVTFRDPHLTRCFGEPALDPRAAGLLEQNLDSEPGDIVHVRRTSSPALRQILESTGYAYLFPLRSDDRPAGVLLADPAPHVFLDENESILLGLVRQISHSLEACRLVDEKIALEKTLLAQEHLAALGNAAATIAHEVKNPLGSIRALSQLMAEDPDVEMRHGEGLRFIMSECDRLDASVRQLLTFSRPPSGELGEVDVSRLLETLARTLDREHSAGGIRVEATIAPRLTLSRASSDSLQQIVFNLALNAIQASQPPAVVRLEAARSGDSIVISVTDDGPGITPELREKIFLPYYTTKQKGAGLGLPIVRKNVRHLGGRLELASPVANGRGTCMTVILPAS